MRRVSFGARIARPDDRHVRGRPDAPVVLLEYEDLSCPYCAAAAPVLRALVEEEGAGVRLVVRHFPRTDEHPRALDAALAAEAAGEAGAFWPFHDALLAAQGDQGDDALQRLAEEHGVHPRAVVGRRARRHLPAVEHDVELGYAAGVMSTPALYLDGAPWAGAVELGALRAAVARAVADA